MPVDHSDLDKALDSIRRTYGSESIRDNDDRDLLVRIPTGDPMLDWAIGGGIPLGRWAHFYGGYASAKTLTAWKAIATAQKMGLTAAYYNIEKQYDPFWAEMWGVDVDNLHVIEGTVIEETGEKLETLLGAINLHVLDSLAAAVSVDELAGKASDWHPGIGARAWGKVLRRANERFDPKENTVILINQTRDIFGRGGGEAPTGGKAIEYLSSLSLHFKRSSWLFKDKNGVLQDEGSNKDTFTKDLEPEGIEFLVRAAKTRVSRPNRTARMRLDYTSGSFDSMWALSRACVFFKLVEIKGSWYTFPDGTKVQGENGIRTYLAGNDEFRDMIQAKLLSDV